MLGVQSDLGGELGSGALQLVQPVGHASDATSGIQNTVYSLDEGATWTPYSDAFTISSNATNTVHAVTRDHAENVTTAQLSIPIDKQLPHVDIEITGQRGQGNLVCLSIHTWERFSVTLCES
ncbi:MAG: hypothetical protein EA396_06815 [Anaerolineaceae bacterium]|nr:MAG: hypothetical protein EA396_06815 [Anaerolineaceae bacterium]